MNYLQKGYTLRLSIFHAARKGLCAFYSVNTSLKRKAKMGIVSISSGNFQLAQGVWAAPQPETMTSVLGKKKMSCCFD